MKKAKIFVILLAVLFFTAFLVQAKPDQNPATDIERGVFVHYPHAQGLAKGAGATGDQVNDYKYSGIHWAGLTPNIEYKINPVNNQDLSLQQIRDAVDLAFGEWMDHNPADYKYIRFSYDGTTDLNTPANPKMDNVNTVSFEPLNSAYPNAIAVTFYWYYRGSKELVETDTVFNSDLLWSVSKNGVSGTYDLQNIATHEFGHWLLLGDLYSLRDWALTMYGYGYKGDIEKRSLGVGDITGINRIY